MGSHWKVSFSLNLGALAMRWRAGAGDVFRTGQVWRADRPDSVKCAPGRGRAKLLCGPEPDSGKGAPDGGPCMHIDSVLEEGAFGPLQRMKTEVQKGWDLISLSNCKWKSSKPKYQSLLALNHRRENILMRCLASTIDSDQVGAFPFAMVHIRTPWQW
jgi:hypothetical protein